MMNNTNFKMPSIKTIVISVILAALVIGSLAAIGYRISPALRAYKAVEEGDFVMALEIYEEKVDGQLFQNDKFESLLKDYLGSIEKDYSEGGLKDLEMRDIMESLARFGIETVSEECKKYIADIDEL